MRAAVPLHAALRAPGAGHAAAVHLGLHGAHAALWRAHAPQVRALAGLCTRSAPAAQIKLGLSALPLRASLGASWHFVLNLTESVEPSDSTVHSLKHWVQHY